MKKCARCGESKPLDNFWPSSRGIYSARCKGCHGLAERTCRVCSKTFVGVSRQVLCSPECKAIDRPQTFRNCPTCGKRFGPIDHLFIKHCSVKCAGVAKRTGVHRRPPTPKARSANRLLRYYVVTGKIVRPTECEQCGQTRKIEAAHADYAKPLEVRWLCVPCHRVWDKTEPKGGTIARAARFPSQAA
jgi:ribosomal protein S27AE